MVRKKVTYKDKVEILLKPYISAKDIQIVLDCTYSEAKNILQKIQQNLIKNNYSLLNIYKVPSKLFMEVCEISLHDFIEKAKIEREL